MTILEMQVRLKRLMTRMTGFDEDQEKAAKYLEPVRDELNKAVQKIRQEGIELEPFPLEGDDL